MIIHQTVPGDTYLSVARQYGISPTRLIEDNAPSDPDRLAVGESLLIFRPSRTHTVRGGDSFSMICRRYGVDERRLLSLNPAIGKKRELYPGQVLALGSSEPSRGPLAVNGYAAPGIERDILHSSLSALTYLTIIGGFYTSERGFRCRGEEDLIRSARSGGVLPLFLLSENSCEIPDGAFEELRARGYGGIVFSGSVPRQTAFAARRQGLLTVSEGECEGCELRAIPCTGSDSFPSRCHAALREARQAERAFIELPYHATDTCGKEAHPIPLASVPSLCRRRNTTIEHSDNGMSYLQYIEKRGGRDQEHKIFFEDLSGIQKGLAMIGESGIFGVSLHLAFSPASVRLLLAAQFDITHHPLS
jgi:LysM repeat protein